MRLTALFLLLMSVTTGCARYEFHVVQPTKFAGHVGSKSDYVLVREPLEYKLRAVSSSLVMRIYNPTQESITLLGQQSSAVDPDDQSHPLPTQTIAPHSFIKLIFPPPRPYIEGYRRTFGIGVGAVYGRAYRNRYDNDAFYDDWTEPRYLVISDDANIYFWTWKGESQIRLSLVFQRGEETFSHDFVIGRTRVK